MFGAESPEQGRREGIAAFLIQFEPGGPGHGNVRIPVFESPDRDAFPDFFPRLGQCGGAEDFSVDSSSPLVQSGIPDNGFGPAPFPERETAEHMGDFKRMLCPGHNPGSLSNDSIFE